MSFARRELSKKNPTMLDDFRATLVEGERKRWGWEKGLRETRKMGRKGERVITLFPKSVRTLQLAFEKTRNYIKGVKAQDEVRTVLS